MDPLVLFVGRLATQKGPDLLVEAIPLVLNSRHDVKFAVVGDGYMRADLERRSSPLFLAAPAASEGSRRFRSVRLSCTRRVWRAAVALCVVCERVGGGGSWRKAVGWRGGKRPPGDAGGGAAF